MMDQMIPEPTPSLSDNFKLYNFYVTLHIVKTYVEIQGHSEFSPILTLQCNMNKKTSKTTFYNLCYNAGYFAR